MLAEDVRHAFNMERKELQNWVAILRPYGLADFEEDYEGQWLLRVRPEALTWIGDFCHKAHVDLDTFLIKLRFDQLDTWGEPNAA